jgi:hypothetical protein
MNLATDSITRIDPETTEADDEDEMEDDPSPDIEVDWNDYSAKYEVVSTGEEGFDRVTRPDFKSAQSAAKVHQRVTGNECEINQIE